MMRPTLNKDLILPGLNIQIPWSTQILNGSKTIETRNYPLPKHYIDIPIAIVETPGLLGLFKARTVGLVWFSGDIYYETEEAFKEDVLFHHVTSDSEYYWKSYPKKYGWIISKVVRFMRSVEAPGRRGIVWTGPVSLPSEIVGEDGALV